MTFLPIVARELRVAARRRGTFWSRLMAGVAAIVAGLIVYLEAYSEPPHELGLILFKTLAVLAFVYCLCAGVRATADCLSEEKREGTLGLLFLTDLKGYDVIIGKLVATSLNSFYGLLAILPVLAIPLLMGGVTNGEFWRMALVLANTFLFSLAIGMFISSISTYPRRAMAATFCLLLIFSIGLPLCQAWFDVIQRSHNLSAVLTTICPDTAMDLFSDSAYGPQKRDFWWSVGAIHGLSWLLIALASLIVPRSWQDRPAGAQLSRWRENWHRWSYGDTAERLAFRRRLLDINAFFWLAGRARLKPTHVWVTLTVLACLWSWGAVEFGKDWLSVGIYFLTALVINSTLKIWIASEAGRRLGEDRKIGALELVLSTPLSVPEILRGQLLALQRQFLGPLAVALLVEAIFLMASLGDAHNNADGTSGIFAGGVAIMIMLVADSLALSAQAMWSSLTANNPNRATGMALRRIMLLPWAIIFAFTILISLTNYNRYGGGPSWQPFVGLYFCAGLLTDLCFGLSAWRRLHTEFREAATRRFAPRPAFWRRLLGRTRPQSAPTAPPVVAS